MSEEKYGFKIGQKVRLVSGGGVYPLNGFDNGNEYIVHEFAEHRDVKECVCIQLGTWLGYASKLQLESVTTGTTVTGPATITVPAGETITFKGNATVQQDWVPKFGDRVTFVEPPSDMVGEFGVVMSVDESCTYPYKVAYDDGQGSDCVWSKLSDIKPYEAE